MLSLDFLVPKDAEQHGKAINEDVILYEIFYY